MSDTQQPGSDTAQIDIDPDVLARRWKILAVLCTSLMVVIVGNTALNVALPTLARELSASISEQQWMVDAYGLVFAGLLLTAGTIGDRYGRKGTLQAGLTIFLAGSLFSAFSHSAVAIIAGARVMGLGAGIHHARHTLDPHQRLPSARARQGHRRVGRNLRRRRRGRPGRQRLPAPALLVGIRLLGQRADHRCLARRRLPAVAEVARPESRAARPDRCAPVDRRSELARVRDHRSTRSWLGEQHQPHVVRHRSRAVAAFLMWELRNTAPMLNLRYFLDPRFGVAAGVITLVFFCMFGFFFLLTQYFQLVLGYGTLEAGIKQLPFAAVMMVVAPNSPKFAARFGANVAVAIGLVGMSAGMFMFTLARTDTSYLQIVLVVMVMAAGMAMTIPTMTGSIMSAVPMGKAGVGSAMNDTTRELGGALGVAVLGSLVASRYDSEFSPALDLLPVPLQGQASQSLAGALHVAADPSVSDGAQGCRLRKKRSCPACISPQSSPAASRWSPPASCTASCRQAIRTPRVRHRSPGRPRISRSSDRIARVGPDSVLLVEHLAAVAELGFVDLADADSARRGPTHRSGGTASRGANGDAT